MKLDETQNLPVIESQDPRCSCSRLEHEFDCAIWACPHCGTPMGGFTDEDGMPCWGHLCDCHTIYDS